MTDNTRISLDETCHRFIARQVHSGRYSCADDVVRAGLKLLEAQEQALEALRNALIEGEESGNDAPLDIDQIRDEARREAKLNA
jgi:antitoxin ParD1/3/4